MLKEPVSYNTGLWNPKNFYGLVQQKGPWPNQAIDNEKRKPQPLPAGVVGKGGTLHAGNNYWNLDTTFMSDIHTLGDTGSLKYHHAPAIILGKPFVGGGASLRKVGKKKKTLLDPNTLKHFAQLAEFLGKYPGDGDPKDADLNRKPLVTQAIEVPGTQNIEPSNYTVTTPYLPPRELDIPGLYIDSPSSGGTFLDAMSGSNYSASTGTFYGFPSPIPSPVITNIPLATSPTLAPTPGSPWPGVRLLNNSPRSGISPQSSQWPGIEPEISPRPGIAPEISQRPIFSQENLTGYRERPPRPVFSQENLTGYRERPRPQPIITRRLSDDNQFAPNAFSPSSATKPIKPEILKILEKYPPSSPVWTKTTFEADIPKIDVTINEDGVIKKSPPQYFDELLNESIKNRLEILGKYEKPESPKPASPKAASPKPVSPRSLASALSIDTTESNMELSNRLRNLKEVQSLSDEELSDRIKKLYASKINPAGLEFDDLMNILILNETTENLKNKTSGSSSSSSSSGTEAKFDEKLEMINLKSRVRRLLEPYKKEKSPEYFDVFSPKIENGEDMVVDARTPDYKSPSSTGSTYIPPPSVAQTYQGPPVSKRTRSNKK